MIYSITFDLTLIRLFDYLPKRIKNDYTMDLDTVSSYKRVVSYKDNSEPIECQTDCMVHIHTNNVIDIIVLIIVIYYNISMYFNVPISFARYLFCRNLACKKIWKIVLIFEGFPNFLRPLNILRKLSMLPSTFLNSKIQLK